MFTANNLRTAHRTDYLIYMWYVETVLRAFNCDIEAIAEQYLPRFKSNPEYETSYQELRKWYADLCDMMHREGCTKEGHLQMVQNVEQDLLELHQFLLAHPDRFPDYRAAFATSQPILVEYRAKQGCADATDLHVMLQIVFMSVMSYVQQKSLNKETLQAIETVGKTLKLISAYYPQNEIELIS